jgi:hypothetical protein
VGPILKSILIILIDVPAPCPAGSDDKPMEKVKAITGITAFIEIKNCYWQKEWVRGV